MQREEPALIGCLANLRYEDAPEPARREAAVRLLDQVGVIIGGVPEQRYADLVRRTFDERRTHATVQAILGIDDVADVAALALAFEPSPAVVRSPAVPA